VAGCDPKGRAQTRNEQFLHPAAWLKRAEKNLMIICSSG
jgi:hypothetical protein